MSSLSPTDQEALIRANAGRIAQEIGNAAAKARNEAELVAPVATIIEDFAKYFDVELHPDRERPLAVVNGRADAVYNRMVIEYEPPRSLHKENNRKTNEHAIGQVKQYLEGLEWMDRHRKERLAGVALDGYYYIFVRYRDDKWFIDDPLPVSAHSTETFLRYLLSLSTELALTPENLVRDFGENSNTARKVVPALYGALQETDNPKVEVLFKQWRRQFSEVTGYDASSGQLDAAGLAKSYAVQDWKPDLEKLFFAIHTYYASFIKLLAVQVAHYYLMPKLGTGLAAAANYETEKLQGYMQQMEEGGLFGQLGIKNFLEGDFFGWYLEIWDEKLDEAVRRLIGDLANYSLVTLDVDPEETRDLLKQLYQNLMPKKLRHALGEYYTPDWLAERLLNQLGYDGNPSKRLLDPACGSGTFLVLAIKRVRKYVDDHPPMQMDRVLNQVLENIVGFDLNPLAVISARTNYLLALGELLPYRRGDISIPVYIADSILTPSMEVSEGGQMSFMDLRAAEGDEKVRRAGYSFNTAVGRFTVPGSLVSAHYLDQFANLLEECVHSGLAAEEFKARLLKTFPLHEANEEDGVGIAVELYEQLMELENQGINGIWARIIKNAFAPLFQGRFDYVAGNPPWVNWESLPGDYRQETFALWQKYSLLPEDRADARQRSERSKTDISILMMVVGIDQYLKRLGKLGFVITQTVFKTERGGRGLRRFLSETSIPAKVEYVDDLSRLQVFDGAHNRTAVLIVRKGQSTTYPIRYGYWQKTQLGASIPGNLPLNDALARVAISRWSAEPISKHDIASPWITGKAKAVAAIQRVIGRSAYYELCREGANTRGANGIYWVQKQVQNTNGSSVVANIPEAGRRKITTAQGAVEDSLIYPLLRGQEVARWTANPTSCIVLPYDPRKPGVPIAQSVMEIEYPKALKFLSSFRDELRSRSKFRNFDPQTGEFYMLYNVGSYSFAPYKLVWREQAASLTASVVGPYEGKSVIPDHKLMGVSFSDEHEAHYLCACMNNSPARYIIDSYAIEIQISTHVLLYVAVPTFDMTNPLHMDISDCSHEAHEAASIGDTGRVKEIEVKIDKLAAKLWGLADAELKEIQESLAELG